MSVDKNKPPVVKEEQEQEVVVKYRYPRMDKRDPFKPLVEIKKKVQQAPVRESAAVPEDELTPLQKVDIERLRLLGIIVGKNAPRAMVDAPDGKSYILKKGTKVGKNNGEVVDIAAEVVLVRERYQDFTGEMHENIVEIRLPAREGDR
ncbi:MAG: pilus assembly protein PilP [Desulfuromonadales bacterium]|nr:pilus assembly protein PilP [Desulfuromonadales bacterium]